MLFSKEFHERLRLFCDSETIAPSRILLFFPAESIPSTRAISRSEKIVEQGKELRRSGKKELRVSSGIWRKFCHNFDCDTLHQSQEWHLGFEREFRRNFWKIFTNQTQCECWIMQEKRPAILRHIEWRWRWWFFVIKLLTFPYKMKHLLWLPC